MFLRDAVQFIKEKKLLSVIGKKIFIKSEIQKSLELLTPFMTEVVII